MKISRISSSSLKSSSGICAVISKATAIVCCSYNSVSNGTSSTDCVSAITIFTVASGSISSFASVIETSSTIGKRWVSSKLTTGILTIVGASSTPSGLNIDSVSSKLIGEAGSSITTACDLGANTPSER